MAAVVAVAFPAQGHINAMLQLCHILASHGCSVTVCNTQIFHQQLISIIHKNTHNSTHTNNDNNSDGNSDEYIDTYSSGGKISYVGLNTLLGDSSVSWDAAESRGKEDAKTWDSRMNMLGDSLHSFLQKQYALHGKTKTRPSCIISDVLLSTTTQRVADLHGLPWIAFLPFCQTFNLLYLLEIQLPPSLHDKLRDYGDTSIVELACNVPHIKAYCLPTYFHIDDITKETNQNLLNQFKALHRAERVLVNSFWEIEEFAIQAIPNVYPIGPLFTPKSNQKHQQHPKRKSLWLEEVACLKWLDNQPKQSVIYVCFGSITLLSKLQMQELAIGLEESGYKVLIVFRPKMIKDAPNVLGSQFFASTLANNHSFIVTWAPQLQVLSHPSIGAFITHCGWNSIMESIWNGVPMLCWPYFADQMLNSHLVAEIWRIGTSLKFKENEFVSRERVKKMIGLLMEENEGNFIKTRITNLKEVALRNTMEGGLSWKNIKLLIDMINNQGNNMVGKS